MPKKTQFVRRCIFCDKPGVSKEHFWPQWMHPLLPDGEGFRTLLQRAAPASPPQERARVFEGPTKNKTIECVCEPCNNEWMSALEERVRPTLEALMAMRTLDIGADDRRELVRYFIMKAMVADRNASETSVFTDLQRRAFHLGRSVPSRVRVAIARYKFETDVVGQFNKGTLAGPELTPSGEMQKTQKIGVFTFRLGELFVLVAICQFIIMEKFADPNLLYISDEFASRLPWPPRRALRTDEALRLQYAIQNGDRHHRDHLNKWIQTVTQQ